MAGLRSLYRLLARTPYVNPACRFVFRALRLVSPKGTLTSQDFLYWLGIRAPASQRSEIQLGQNGGVPLLGATYPTLTGGGLLESPRHGAARARHGALCTSCYDVMLTMYLLKEGSICGVTEGSSRLILRKVSKELFIISPTV